MGAIHRVWRSSCSPECCTDWASLPQIVLPVGALLFVGAKWYHRSRRRRRQREEKQIVRRGSRSQDVRDLNV